MRQVYSSSDICQPARRFPTEKTQPNGAGLRRSHGSLCVQRRAAPGLRPACSSSSGSSELSPHSPQSAAFTRQCACNERRVDGRVEGGARVANAEQAPRLAPPPQLAPRGWPPRADVTGPGSPRGDPREGGPCPWTASPLSVSGARARTCAGVRCLHASLGPLTVWCS